MITAIQGTLLTVDDEEVVIEARPFQYTVLVPEIVRRQLQGSRGKLVSLFTMHYLEGNPARGKVIPRLVGFWNPAEREFFELFCSVDGVGIKTALRALVRPVEEIAQMIEEQDAKGLSALPGIGAATSERIIAKLRRKMPKFALLITKTADPETAKLRDVFAEAFDILRTLGHSESDARRLLQPLIDSGRRLADVDKVIQEVYAQNRQA
jgi:Holliday junction DNA helicase RuvA